MGKDLRGKEIGTGFTQLKDGRYIARYTSRDGKRHQRYGTKLQELRKWRADCIYEDEHGGILSDNPTIDAWFTCWLNTEKHNNIKQSTEQHYLWQYNLYVKPYIGSILLKDLRPILLNNLLNQLAEERSLSNTTIESVRVMLHGMLCSAEENGYISKSPVTKSVKCLAGKPPSRGRVLTVSEEKDFLLRMAKSVHYDEFAFMLQTGLRAGEMFGLRWEDVDLEGRLLHVERQARYDGHTWYIDTPKSRSGIRTIPLTEEAIQLLKNRKEKHYTPDILQINFNRGIFLNLKTGFPYQTCTYYLCIERYCKKYDVPMFSLHTLRHTFATRCIEAGMNPKALQRILGHSKLETTMNLYVHVTEDYKLDEMKKIESMLKVV